MVLAVELCLRAVNEFTVIHIHHSCRLPNVHNYETAVFCLLFALCKVHENCSTDVVANPMFYCYGNGNANCLATLPKVLCVRVLVMVT